MCSAKCREGWGWWQEDGSAESRGQTAAWPKWRGGDDPGRQCPDEDRPPGPGRGPFLREKGLGHSE